MAESFVIIRRLVSRTSVSLASEVGDREQRLDGFF